MTATTSQLEQLPLPAPVYSSGNVTFAGNFTCSTNGVANGGNLIGDYGFYLERATRSPAAWSR